MGDRGATGDDRRHDFDWLVIGSEFGGSVAALRLTENGYRVGVLECGRRYEDSDFARSAWNLRTALAERAMSRVPPKDGEEPAARELPEAARAA